MRIWKYFCLIFISFLLCSCSSKVQSKVILTEKNNFQKSDIKTFETQQLRNLEINIKQAEIFFYSWEKKQVKIEFESTIPNTVKKEKQEEMLNLYRPVLEFNDDILTIKQTEKVKSKNSDISNRINIYAPCNIGKLSVIIENGFFKSSGDLDTAASMKIINGDIDISRYNGAINASIVNGNINISSGKLRSESNLICKTGNISIKTEILNSDPYKFSVDTGNIEVRFPARLMAKFTCQGNIISNDFTGSTMGPGILISSKLGSIVIKKY